MPLKYNRSARAAAVLFAAILMIAVSGCGLLHLGADRPITIPKNPPANSLMVFYLRPSGDADARYYAVGFARAVGHKLQCPHSSLTMQINPYAESRSLRAQRDKPEVPVSRETALKVSRTLGARYALTGDLQLTGDKITIAYQLLDTTAPSQEKRFTASGRLAELPSMQVALAKQIVQAMNLKPDDEQSKALAQPTFSNPKTLALIGRGYITKDREQAAAYGWQALRADGDSLFAMESILGCYGHSGFRWKEIKRSKDLTILMGNAAKRFSEDPGLKEESAWIYAHQYEYSAAQAMLESVTKADPKSLSAHIRLMCVAKYRRDAELAVKEAQTIVSLWPSSIATHAELGDAYALRADAARRSHSSMRLTRAARGRWQNDSTAAFQEASAVVKIDRDYEQAWSTIMDRSLDMHWYDYADRAFQELIHIDPKNPRIYEHYVCPLAERNVRNDKREAALALADKNLSTADAYLVQGWHVLCANPSYSQLRQTFDLADKAIKQSKLLNLDATELACHTLMDLKRGPDMLKIAKIGFGEDPSPRWRALLIRAYLWHWRDAHDRSALDQATELATGYVEEVPGDTLGHNQLGFCLIEQGKRAEAGQEFRKSLDLDPSDEYAKQWLPKTK